MTDVTRRLGPYDGRRAMGRAGRRGAIGLMLALGIAACAAPPAPTPPAEPPAVVRLPRSIPPAATACPTPAFPAGVRGSDASGLSRVTGEVQPDGSVRSVVVVRSSGPSRAHKLLDRAAAEALAACRYPPEPGTSPATTTVDFRWAPD